MTSAPVAVAAPLIERGNCGIGFIADQYGRAGHAILRTALDALLHLEHRGALAADATTGDGAGVLTPIPHKLFAREAERLIGKAVDPTSLGVGVFFFQPGTEKQCHRLLEEACTAFDLTVLCWRDVPVNPAAIGERARAMMPVIQQAVISHQSSVNSQQFERSLYLARKQFEKSAQSLGAYVPSMSARTIVYKGLFLARQVGKFYADLSDPDYEVALTVFHQRYSTNTLPTWQRAQPFRVLCHNGEINTLQGNVNWMKSREPILQFSDLTDTDLTDCANLRFAENLSGLFRPVIDTSGSDSAMLDNAMELLVQGGRDVRHAVTMMVPPAWEKLPDLPQEVRDFYEYHTCLTEPWDGPAALVFTDGVIVGAALDRNGLRPNRFLVTHDGLVVAGSEAGIVAIEDSRVKVKGKLGPGQMIAVDTANGRVLFDRDIKTALSARQPYGEWVRRNVRHLSDLGHLPLVDNKPYFQLSEAGLQTLLQKQAAFGYTNEELIMVLRPMAEDGVEALGSMGDDTPAAALSEKPRPLFAYFRQRFAEVTNPPIDPLREELVMSLKVRLGARSNFLAETEQQANLLELDSPFLTEDDLDLIKRDPYLKPVTLSTLFPINDGPAGIEATLARICAEAEHAVTHGAQILILSDRNVNARYTFAPSLLALGAVHNYLLERDLRTKVDFIIESGEPRDVHHFACLIGYGAAAICPYLALSTVAEMRRGNPQSLIPNYLHAAEHGLLKIMSKMGISTVDA
ncbi:MAG: glutamate synthase central domain-containing protein, partial [Anaerolineales bacterium]